MIVMPLTWALTSRRRFTLLKLFKASAMSFGAIPHEAARAAAAVAFHTLYSPARANSKSAQCALLCSTDQVVAPGSRRKLVTFQLARGPAPYRSIGLKAFARLRSRLALSILSPAAPSNAMM